MRWTKEALFSVIPQKRLSLVKGSIISAMIAALVQQRNTSRSSQDYLQASVVVVPSTKSEQLERFCEFNKGPCPVLYRSKTGDTTAGNLARDISDIRTTLGSYFVLENGQKVSHIADLKEFPWDDMVTFYIGSVSHCVEKLLQAAGKTSLYKTNIQCEEAGPFSCPMVVSMQPIPRELLERTIAITAHLGTIQLAPIHIGDPSVVGIKDINRPDYGDPPEVEDMVPVFWASSVTSHLAVRSAGLPLAFTDDMQHLFVCDTTIEQFLHKHPPIDADIKPRVVTLKEKPFVASLLSENAAMRIGCLETEIQDDIGKRGIAKLYIPGELVKAALVLSHSSTVAVHFGFPCNTNEKFPDETDGPPGAVAIGRALQALGKKVTFIASSYHVELVRELVRKFLGNEVTVAEFTPLRTHGPDKVGIASEEFLFHDGGNQTSPKFDALVAIEATSRTEKGCYMTMKGRDLSGICKDSPVDELFIQAHKLGKIVTIGIGDGGNEIGMGKVRKRVIDHVYNGPIIASSVSTDHLITAGVSNWGGSALAAALLILNHCPVHSRFTRRGVGKERVISFEKVLNTVKQEEEILSYIGELGVRDGISQWKKMSVDDHPFDPVHKDKLQKLLALAVRQSVETKPSSFL